MNKKSIVVSLSVITLCGLARAEEGSALWGWNISAGGNIGFGLKPKLINLSGNALGRLPALHPDMGTTDRETAKRNSTPVKNGPRVDYGGDDGGAFYVDPASSWGESDPNETVNWRLPHANVDGATFVMDGEDWGEVISKSESFSAGVAENDSDVAYGASVDLSHLLWASEDGTWGVDFTVGLTWMRAGDCYRSGGVIARRSATTQDGTAQVIIPADCLESQWGGPESDNTWGSADYNGNFVSGRNDPVIELDRITARDGANPTKSYADTTYLWSHGDYEEWEISALLKPWYDVNDWLCLHAMLGAGVTRSSFEYTTEAACNGARIYRSSQEFHEWKCYGIAGAGLLLRAGDFDLSCDGLFRWCQKDMEIRGQDVRGTLEKPWAVIRLGLSYAF